MRREPDFRALTKLNLTTGSLFIDVGANCGQSIAALRSLFPGCAILAFEPNPIAFRYAERALHSKARLISPLGLSKKSMLSQAFNVALGAAAGSMELHVPTCCGIVCHQLASLKQPDLAKLEKFLKDSDFRFASRDNIEIIRTTVAIKPLDDFDLTPDFVKIDVEGHELAVLAGATETLRRSTPILMIEWGERPEILALLRQLGYNRFIFDGKELVRTDDRPSANSIYLHSLCEPRN
jgi:FkbM family methyltransferase